MLVNRFVIVTCAYGVKNVRAVPEGIEVIAEREQIPRIVAHLVERNIDIYGVRVYRQSLEDQFLEMTGVEQLV